MVLKANWVLSACPEPVDETISQKRQLLSATSNSQIAKRASYIQKEEETSNYSSAPEATVADRLPSPRLVLLLYVTTAAANTINTTTCDVACPPQACSSAFCNYSYHKYFYYLRSHIACLLEACSCGKLFVILLPTRLARSGCHYYYYYYYYYYDIFLQLLLLILQLLLVMLLLLLKLVGKAPLSFNWWLTGGIQEENREVSDLICGYPKTSKEGQIVSVTTKKYPEFLLNLQFCSFPSFCLSFRNPGNRPLNNVWSLIPIEKNCNLQM